MKKKKVLAEEPRLTEAINETAKYIFKDVTYNNIISESKIARTIKKGRKPKK